MPYQGAAAASYAPGGQPARHTCHRDPARPAHSASTPRGPPRYSGGCRVTQHSRRASPGLGLAAAGRNRSKMRSRFTRHVGAAGSKLASKPTLERLGVQPEARERGAAQAAGARSARTLQVAPACLWMACASSEATARCGHRNPVGYARFAPPAVTPAIAVTPRNNPCVTCVTCVTRRMYVCLGGGERGPKFH